MKIKAALLLLWLSAAGLGGAQPSFAWKRSFAAITLDWTVDESGNQLVLSEGGDESPLERLEKIAPNGNTAWSATRVSEFSLAKGGVLWTGASIPQTQPHRYDVQLSKRNSSNGSVLWSALIPRSLDSAFLIRCKALEDGGVLLLIQESSLDDSKTYIRLDRYSSGGAKLWSQTLPRVTSGGALFGAHLELDGQGDILVYGVPNSSPSTGGLLQKRSLVSGTLSWSISIPEITPPAINPANEIFYGNATGPGAPAYVQRLSAGGAKIWKRSLFGTLAGGSVRNLVVQTADSRTIYSGTVIESVANNRAGLALISANGALLWEILLGSSSAGIALDSAEKLYWLYHTANAGGGEFRLSKRHLSGVQEWEQTVPFSAGIVTGYVSPVKVGPDGGIYLLGARELFRYHQMPVAADDASEVGYRGVATGKVLANDQFGQGASAVLVSGPRKGFLRLRSNGLFAYTPRAGFANTSDSFVYRPIRGSLQGQSATVTIKIWTANPGTVTALSFAKTSVIGGQSVAGALTLSQAAGTNGNSAVLASGNESVLIPPLVLTVPAGASSVTFNVNTRPVSANTLVNLTAVRLGTSMTVSLTILAPQLSGLTLSKTAVRGGENLTGSAMLNGAAAMNLSVALSDNTSAITVPSSATIAAGKSSATFGISTMPVSSTYTRTISATHGGITKTANLTLTP